MTAVPGALKDPLPDVLRIAVLGLGRSGIAAAQLLARFDKKLLLSDSRQLDPALLHDQLPADAELILGENSIDGVDIAVISPGIPPSSPIVAAARLAGVPLISELELGYRATGRPIVAITGTDGKTTTTMMTGAIFDAAHRSNTVCGNIGTPLCEALLDDPGEWLIVEVSAFQLLHATSFSPDVLIATNIAADHLDYFDHDEVAYVRAKRRPLEFMESDSTVVLNASDETVRLWQDCAHCSVSWYGLPRDLPPEATVTGALGSTSLNITSPDLEFTIPLAGLNVVGQHNHFNALAASLGALASGIEADSICRGLSTFQPPPHRIQTISSFDGLTWINDSKATNAHAAMAALSTVSEPLVLIAGGVDKGLVLDDWIRAMEPAVQAVVTIGELAPRLEQEIAERGLLVPIRRAGSMPEAVSMAHSLATDTSSRVVMLSPACSSFDMFDSYAARGDAFTAAVSALEVSA